MTASHTATARHEHYDFCVARVDPNRSYLEPGSAGLQPATWGPHRSFSLRRERPGTRVDDSPGQQFSLPLAGEIDAAGQRHQIQTELTTKLSKFIPEAVVTVSVTGIEGNRVYVIGQVQQPGSFVMNPTISVLQL